LITARAKVLLPIDDGNPNSVLKFVMQTDITDSAFNKSKAFSISSCSGSFNPLLSHSHIFIHKKATLVKMMSYIETLTTRHSPTLIFLPYNLASKYSCNFLPTFSPTSHKY